MIDYELDQHSLFLKTSNSYFINHEPNHHLRRGSPINKAKYVAYHKWIKPKEEKNQTYESDKEVVNCGLCVCKNGTQFMYIYILFIFISMQSCFSWLRFACKWKNYWENAMSFGKL